MRRSKTPLYSEMKKYVDSKPIPFHMPGHKLGAGFTDEFRKNMATYDLTEIPGLDNLHYPEEIILEAQKLAAEAFGADNSFFLVNGSTVGILATIFTVCKAGDSLIVARDCHKSVTNGMIMAGVNPIYIKPSFNNEFGISIGISGTAVLDALINNPEAVGVLLTRPNYYGCCCDIKEIAEIVHKHGRILIVDEAHGAHLHFNNNLPLDAIMGGADICVQSAHKTLPALTQAALLHVKGDRINIDKLKFYLSTFQTSSPSYIIMASLDIARATMESHGKEMLERLLENVISLKRRLKSIKKIKILSGEGQMDFEIDQTRIVINVKELGITGFLAEKILRESFNIQIEMSDLYNIVCIATIADEEENFEKLYRGIEEIASRFKNGKPLADIYNVELLIPRQVVSLRDTLLCSSKSVKFEDALNKVSLNTITPYPPGIPIICPGEEISEETYNFISKILRAGGKVNGIGNTGEINIIA
jgi:lysine decarboxylase